MFGFPAQQKDENFKFSRNFLRTVVFQVKFPAINDFAGKQSEIQESVKPMFSNANADTKIFQLSVDEGTPVITNAEGIPGLLEFQDTSRQKLFTVAQDTLSLTISGNAYTNFQQVQSDLVASIYKVIELLGIESFNRVAVRKVNLVSARARNPDIPQKMGSVLLGVFNEALVQSPLSMPPAENLLTTVTNSRFVDGDNTLNIIYGLLPRQDFEPDANHALLDIDLFNSAQHSSIEELKVVLNDINDNIYNVFIWSLQPSLLSILSE